MRLLSCQSWPREDRVSSFVLEHLEQADFAEPEAVQVGSMRSFSTQTWVQFSGLMTSGEEPIGANL